MSVGEGDKELVVQGTRVRRHLSHVRSGLGRLPVFLRSRVGARVLAMPFFAEHFSPGAGCRSFVGPTLGGVSVQWIGFEWTVTAIAVIHVVFVSLNLSCQWKELASSPRANAFTLERTLEQRPFKNESGDFRSSPSLSSTGYEGSVSSANIPLHQKPSSCSSLLSVCLCR